MASLRLSTLISDNDTLNLNNDWQVSSDMNYLSFSPLSTGNFVGGLSVSSSIPTIILNCSSHNQLSIARQPNNSSYIVSSDDPISLMCGTNSFSISNSATLNCAFNCSNTISAQTLSSSGSLNIAGTSFLQSLTCNSVSSGDIICNGSISVASKTIFYGNNNDFSGIYFDNTNAALTLNLSSTTNSLKIKSGADILSVSASGSQCSGNFQSSTLSVTGDSILHNVSTSVLKASSIQLQDVWSESVDVSGNLLFSNINDNTSLRFGNGQIIFGSSSNDTIKFLSSKQISASSELQFICNGNNTLLMDGNTANFQVATNILASFNSSGTSSFTGSSVNIKSDGFVAQSLSSQQASLTLISASANDSCIAKLISNSNIVQIQSSPSGVLSIFSNSTLCVNISGNSTTFQSDVNTNGSVTIGSALNVVNGTTNLSSVNIQNLNVSGSTTLQALSVTNGIFALNGNFSNSLQSNSLNVNGVTSLNGNINCNSTLSVPTIQIDNTNLHTTNSIFQISNSSKISGSLEVASNLNVDNSVNIGNNLICSNSATVAGVLTVSGITNLGAFSTDSTGNVHIVSNNYLGQSGAASSSDPSLSLYDCGVKFFTNNPSVSPSWLAAVLPRATQVYTVGASGGCALDFYTNPNGTPSTSSPIKQMSIENTGQLNVYSSLSTALNLVNGGLWIGNSDASHSFQTAGGITCAKDVHCANLYSPQIYFGNTTLTNSTTFFSCAMDTVDFRISRNNNSPSYSSSLSLFSLGSQYSDTNFEALQFCTNNSSIYNIRSVAMGTGIVRSLSLQCGNNTNQLVLKGDGSVSFSNGFSISGTNTFKANVSNGTVTTYLDVTPSVATDIANKQYVDQNATQLTDSVVLTLGSTSNVSSCTVVQSKLLRVLSTAQCDLTLTLQIVPSSSQTLCAVNIVLPVKVSPNQTSFECNINLNGYLENSFSSIGNLNGYSVINSNSISIHFTSINSTQNHYVQARIQYTSS